MPTIINGCGTWYYGKRRIHRVKAPCSQCQGFVELESYDTTLYFVVFMVPVVPLGQKRILESCPACQRHKIIKLKDWEAGKAKAFGDILERLQANPDDRETIQTALGLATVYQDEAAFDKLADVLAGHRTDDAEIQAQLGAAYEYFSRWADAEAAYRRAYAVKPDDDIRERLAVCCLKQGRPTEAAEYVTHVFESKDPQKAWLVFWLVEGFLEAGMHDEALKVMDVRDDLWPHLARDKAYIKQRRTAEKHKRTGKPVASAYLRESSRVGVREGSGLGFKWPKYVAAAVFLGLAALYFGVAIYRGQNRKVYLVNGWTKAYTVTLNGESHQLMPNVPKKVDVAEGDVTINWPDGGEGPQTVTVETPFFSRPFKSPVFIINPDRLALLERDTTVYTNDPAPEPDAPEIVAGRLLTEFKEVDHEFEPFPPQIQAKAGSKITKTRVGIVPAASTMHRLFHTQAVLPPDQAREYVVRLLRLEPDDALLVRWVAAIFPPAEALELIRPRLADRPVRIEWHRAYQTVTERTEPDRDLVPEYRKLVEETKRGPAAVYLLGRLEDGPAGEKLYEEAARANPPVGQAASGLGFRLLARGEFGPAVTWTKTGTDLAPGDQLARKVHVDALLAAGKYADVLAIPPGPDGEAAPLLARLTAHVATGERGAAEAEINRAARPLPGENIGPVLQTYRLMLAGAERDRAKYLSLAENFPFADRFTVSFLKGDYKQAAKETGGRFIGDAPDMNWEFETTRAGLLYLAGVKAKDGAFADEQWKALGTALGRGDRTSRWFGAVAAGKQPFDPARATAAVMNPAVKRIVLAAFARKYPEQAKDLRALSRQLDFERDETSLCLRSVLE
jgi:tetratricopeptide (TPR) repeat protein